MKVGWQVRKLGDVCSFLNRGISPKYVEKGGICVLNQKCVRNHSVSFLPSRRHDVIGKNVNVERLVQLGDVLINSTGTGTLGRVAQILIDPTEPTTIDSHITLVRPQSGLFFLKFFGYMIQFLEDEIKKAGEGCGGQTELSRSTLSEKFFVSYPESLDEQQRIVKILDEAFAKIVIAKANAGKNINGVNTLFENCLQEVFSQRDMDWVETTLEKVLTNQPRNGWSPPSAHHSNSGTPVLTLSSVTGFKFRIEKIKHTTANVDLSRHYWVNNGDLLITRSNTPELVGHVAIASGISSPTIYPDLIMRMNPAPDQALTDFLYFQLQSPQLRKEITGRAQGANPTMKKINKRAVQTLPIVVTSLSKQKEVVTYLKKIRAQTSDLAISYKHKLFLLDELKQSLLHQAFAGEL